MGNVKRRPAKRRIKRLSQEVKKLVWAEPKSNAGAGWQTRFKSCDGRVFELGKKEVD